MELSEKQFLEITDADKKLKKICQNGLKKRFGDHPANAVKERLKHELEVVSKNNHSAYYLLASMLADEAKRLHHAIFFRGTITSSLIAYTSGFSDINPMEPEYGGVNLPFETTAEEYEGKKPCLDIQCTVAFILFVQCFLVREIPEYRCLSHPLDGEPGIRAVRLYLVKDDELPVKDPLDMEGANRNDYPDFMFFDDYPRITLIADEKMELIRYNEYYSEDKVVFDEKNADKAVSKIWKYLKNYDQSMQSLKTLKVHTYEELITVMSMAYSTEAWGGISEKMIKDGSLPLAEMVGTRDDVFLYLKKIGFDSKEAFFIMDRVRKGRKPTEDQIAKMRDYGAEEWFLDFCQRVLYLFPRSHIAQMIRRNTFCLRDPQVYKDIPCYHDHVFLHGSIVG